MADSIEIIQKILAVYSLFLIVFGTLTNPFCCYICLRKNLRVVPTFIFLVFMLISDTIALYFWNLNHFVSTFYGYVFEGYGIGVCKFFFTTQLISLQISSWILVRILIRKFFFNLHYFCL
jgi:hypothetical protein